MAGDRGGAGAPGHAVTRGPGCRRNTEAVEGREMKAEMKTGVRITLELDKAEAEQLIKEIGQGTYCRGSACTRLWEALEPAVTRARETGERGYWDPRGGG